jgi:hypothetical protein
LDKAADLVDRHKQQTWKSSLSDILGAGPHLRTSVTNPHGPGPLKAIWFIEDALPHYDIDHTIDIICRKKAYEKSEDGTPEDIFKGTKANGWRGAAFVRRASTQSNIYENMTAGDYKIVTNFMKNVAAPGFTKNTIAPGVSPSPWGETGEPYKGIRLNCNGDRRAMGLYTAVDVAPEHPIWKANKPIPQISKRINLPLYAFKYPPTSESWGQQSYDNHLATFLHLSVEDPNSSYFGLAPPEWQLQVGSILIVRADRIPITLNHAEAIYQYSFKHLYDQFEIVLDSASPALRRKLFNSINKQDFRKFFARYKEERGWIHEKPPYVM